MKRAALLLFLLLAACAQGSDPPAYLLPVDCEALIIDATYIDRAITSRFDAKAEPEVALRFRPDADQIEFHSRLNGLAGWVQRCRAELDAAGYETKSRTGYVTDPSV